MSTPFDYDKAMGQINDLLDELQDPNIRMAELEEKVEKAKKLIEACEKELVRVEDKLDPASSAVD